MPPSQRMLKALTAPNVHVSPLMTAILVHATHLFFNALLLAPWNPVRCCFWKMHGTSCSTTTTTTTNNLAEEEGDVAWILNWFAFAKFHVAVLLGFLGASASGQAHIESKLAFLSLSILMCYLVQGIFSLRYFNVPMAIFQAVILVALMLVILFWVSAQELRPGSAYLATAAFRSRSTSQSQRRKIAIPTLTVGIQAVLSTVRVADMAFGSSNGGYLGDASSDLFQNISNLTTCDVMLVPVVMVFALFFTGVDQHRSLLQGQVVALFVSQIILSSSQGDMMAKGQVQAAMAGTLISIVLSVAGAM